MSDDQRAGSYALASNLKATGNCLVITASGVTIDLMGFSIIGLTPIDFNQFPVRISAGNASGIAVRNGSITNFGTAIDLSGAHGSIVEEVRAYSNNAGILIADGIVRASPTCAVSGRILSGEPIGGVVRQWFE
jgi:hypothetical protein